MILPNPLIPLDMKIMASKRLLRDKGTITYLMYIS